MKKTAVRAKGFTLIELLIVIALLGALAIGLLATIDPFEQLKKGRDTSTRNTVSEFYNANLRYYATKSEFPWAKETSATAGRTSSTVADMSSQVAKLVAAGELKDKFFELAGAATLGKIYVTATDPTHFSVCFEPESKSFQNDPNTMYSQTGEPLTGTCKSQTSTGISCSFCIQ